jgi:hypothetical protein
MRDSGSETLPRWARSLDALCLVLVLGAVVVSLSGGGFRERVFGVRITLSSPDRLLLWAFGLTIVRHLLVRRPPIYAHLSQRLAASWRTTEVRTALGALAGTRPAILFVGYMAIFLIGYPDSRAPWRVSNNEFANLPARWDVGWYLGIARRGYDFTYTAQASGQQQDIVFFPAMPLLMRIAGRLFGGSGTAYVWGGTGVALIAFFGALVYLFRIARDLLEDEDRARTSVWLLASYPFALWFGAPYTESVYLLGALGAFFHFRRGEFLKAAAWGLLVGLTRPNGCFLSIPLAVMAIEPWLPAWLVGRRAESERARPAPVGSRHLIARIATAAMPGIGVLLYCAYVWSLTGNPLSWAEGHVAWGRSYQGLSVLVTDRVTYLSEAGLYAYTSRAADDLVQLVGVVFVLVAAWPVARRLGLSFAVFILVNILPPMAAGGLLSAGRFSSVLFPAFIWFASAIHERHRSIWLTSFMAFQALNAILFFTWRQMY